MQMTHTNALDELNSILYEHMYKHIYTLETLPKSYKLLHYICSCLVKSGLFSQYSLIINICVTALCTLGGYCE